MPEGWRDASKDKQWLHSLFIGIDANFRLKRKDVSSDRVDPDLGNGFAFYVREKPYKEWLAKHENEVEPGLAATGVATIECIQHDMKRPCSVGDLQLGKKYCNIDFLFYWSIINSNLVCFVVSYDIACQWSINLRERMARLDHDFFLFNGTVQVRFFVPKFHLPAHIMSCRTKFSFNYGVGVGRTDGEAPERGWAEINSIASSTKEMGPGSRRDALDSPSLLRKFKAATGDMLTYFVEHFDLTASLPGDQLAVWSAEIEAWEKDSTLPNPLTPTVETPTVASVRHQLAQEEGQGAGIDGESSLDQSISPSVLIACGLELEKEQRALKSEASKIWDHSQDRQRTKLQLRCNAMQRKIATWMKAHQLYIPGVITLIRVEEQASIAQKKTIHPYTMSLWLPSQIGVKLNYESVLPEIEWKLRVAQAFEALDTLRSNLQLRSHLYKFKDRFSRGQHANTRARASIETVQARIQAAAEDYRAAHKALDLLSVVLATRTDLGDVNPANWSKRFFVLETVDIRELSEADHKQVSEGRRKISWIWKVIGATGDETEDLRDGVYYSHALNYATHIHPLTALRVEWCKSRARAARFSELIIEEMKRVIRYLSYRERWWKTKAAYGHSDHLTSLHREGLVAYASRQASLFAELRENFLTLWRDVPNTIADLHKKLSLYSSSSLSISSTVSFLD
ncbi:hypothetical protein H0H93_010103 [Arthromyces matolae]|nr:hypothetical protein H0H93_010103 [Arthromyces matolae]